MIWLIQSKEPKRKKWYPTGLYWCDTKKYAREVLARYEACNPDLEYRIQKYVEAE